MTLLSLSLRASSRLELRAFDRAAADPAAAQADVLRRLARRNAATAFGRDHGLDRVRTPADYARAVPVRSYDQLAPYVERSLRGERAVLTADDPVMFATTSGTTGAPKYIPITAAWREEQAGLTRLWMARALAGHPGCFDGDALLVASRAVEGHAPGGLPYGAMSGVAYQRIPWLVRRRYSVPYEVVEIGDPEERYFATMRFALARRITAIATPNPTTLLRLAETARERAEELIRAIHDGDPLLPSLRGAVRPDPARARELSGALRTHGALRPRDAWPELKLIGCWLGGSAGLHARRLADGYGAAAMRDLGLVASEGRMTIPVEDGTSAGVLALHRSFFEFIAEEEMDQPSPRIHLAHELQEGRRYNLVVTGANGLWRYDMNDIVEVRGRYRNAPLVAFLRKGRDVVSITGEKIHLNQIQAALREAERATSAEAFQFRVIPDEQALRHDLLVEFRRAPASAAVFVRAYDAALARLNCEYAGKRASRRLGPPRLWLMSDGWSERASRADFRRGKREQQYKWPAIGDAWDLLTRGEVRATLDVLAEERA